MAHSIRICSCCGINYTDKMGHNYNACVIRCQARLSALMEQVEDAKSALHRALEIQAQVNNKEGKGYGKL